MSKFVSLLMFSRTQAHAFHLQTRSFAVHTALEEYYTAVVPLTDAYAEAYQGKYGVIKKYYDFTILQGASTKKIIDFFKVILREVMKHRRGVRDTYLANMVDEVITLLRSTLYKLNNLR
jgi:DNA-binding ferritin-like protein